MRRGAESRGETDHPFSMADIGKSFGRGRG